ncbi:MAG: NAD(P)-dependent dehydrogenase (short-subunit alcohol dehydrogenase family) [Saprospiraceae bacterium]|jgi:NAD(P)-dependent dehydrogenase (short-subunit alcohol dehydrogenase family)
MKNYLVIGGSSGIGKTLAMVLADLGNQVYATYKEHPHDSAGTIHYSFLDVLEENLNLDFLPEKIHGIVYCPGTINLKPFARIKPATFIADYNLQVVGAVKIIQAVLSKLKAAEGASVVLFSSVAVQVGFNFHSLVSASKGAIEGLTKALAAELAPNIRVNAIAPSITDTPLAAKLLSSEQKKEANAQRHALKRIGSPEDIAEMAAFLLSNNSSWMTGQIMHIDGGMSSIK